MNQMNQMNESNQIDRSIALNRLVRARSFARRRSRALVRSSRARRRVAESRVDRRSVARAPPHVSNPQTSTHYKKSTVFTYIFKHHEHQQNRADTWRRFTHPSPGSTADRGCDTFEGHDSRMYPPRRFAVSRSRRVARRRLDVDRARCTHRSTRPIERTKNKTHVRRAVDDRSTWSRGRTRGSPEDDDRGRRVIILALVVTHPVRSVVDDTPTRERRVRA